MRNIEWIETHEWEPEIKSIEDFCQENLILFENHSSDNRLIAFIEKQALEGLHDFLAHDISREHGGVLVGLPYYDPGLNQHFVDIRIAIPAYETEGTSVHLQFSPNSWKFISGIIDENHPEMVIIGWYHSHPGLGVFMSGTDQSTQNAFFNHAWNLAVVVDPLVKKTGWFAGSKCQPMDTRYVIPYEKISEILKPEMTEELDEIGELPQPEIFDLRRLNWLLPFFSIFLISMIMVIIKKIIGKNIE